MNTGTSTGSEGATTTTGAPPSGGEGTGGLPSSAAASTTTTTTTSDDVFADLAEDQTSFDRGYVEKLRREGQRYRTDAQQREAELGRYNDVFGVYEDADRQAWMHLASTWAVDPKRAAEDMQRIAQSVLEEQQAGGGTGGNGDGGDDGGDGSGLNVPGLTAEQVRQIVAEERATADRSTAEREAIDGVHKEMRDGGYDPETPEGFMVLYHAAHTTSGDVKKAIEMQDAYKQSIIDSYVEGQKNKPATSPSGGIVANSGQPEQNLDTARRRAENFMRQREGAQPGQ
jgi:hypothetical protein